MSQHFLLSAKARTLSLRNIFDMSDMDCFELFKQVRWADGLPVCPRCGVIGHHYFLKTRMQWRCRDCVHTFSVTSGTMFAFHKLPLKVYLAAIAIYCNAGKGISALQLSRDLDVQYKTAFVLAHKIRESLMEQRVMDQLSGEVHMDGAYVNGYIRPKNKKADRIDRRLAKHQRPDKRCVLVMRQKCEELAGAKRTLTFVLKSENKRTCPRWPNPLFAMAQSFALTKPMPMTRFMLSLIRAASIMALSTWLTMERPITWLSLTSHAFAACSMGRFISLAICTLQTMPMKPRTVKTRAAGQTGKSLMMCCANAFVPKRIAIGVATGKGTSARRSAWRLKPTPMRGQYVQSDRQSSRDL